MRFWSKQGHLVGKTESGSTTCRHWGWGLEEHNLLDKDKNEL